MIPHSGDLVGALGSAILFVIAHLISNHLDANHPRRTAALTVLVFVLSVAGSYWLNMVWS